MNGVYATINDQVVTAGNHDRGQSLCYRCKEISAEKLSRHFGFDHCKSIEDLVESAKSCDLCNLFKEGLLVNIREEFADMARIMGSQINIQAIIWQHRRHSLQTGLRVRVQSLHVSCELNWYLPHNDNTSFPNRPEGVQKLHMAKAWLHHSVESSERLDEEAEEDQVGNESTDQQSTPDFVPTRLLNLGTNRGSQYDGARLVSCSTKLPYAALSHRWGGSQHLTTTKSNHLRHMLGIEFTNLPKTFQDAILVARFIGIQYLWIDALCIVQDDPVDWNREATRMGDIYREALCTFAIHDADDDSAGFLERCLLPSVTVQLDTNGPENGSHVSLRSSFIAGVELSKLSKRGWVLQERFLSTRTLHFADNALFCEDSRGVYTEEDAVLGFGQSTTLAVEGSQDSTNFLLVPPEGLWISSSVVIGITPLTINDEIPLNDEDSPWDDDHSPWEDDDSPWEDYIINASQHGPRKNQLLQKCWPGSYETIVGSSITSSYTLSSCCRGVTGSEHLKYQWFNLLERYCNTNLTYESDKLPAISGLMRVFQKYTSDCQLSGIWRSTLPTGLLWIARGTPLKRPQVKRAASWSWAAMDGPISHPAHGLMSRISLVSEIPEEVSKSFDANCELTIRARTKCLDFLKPLEKNGYGMFRFDFPVNHYSIYVPPNRLPDENEAEKQERNVSFHDAKGQAVLDEKHVRKSQLSKILCIEVAWCGITDWLLLVEESPTQPDRWCRIGVGFIENEIGEERWFSDIEPTTITLV